MQLKIMTFNLRTETSNDGINNFPNRKGRILECIENYAPDIIGFQECLHSMQDWLETALTDYVVLGCGRNKDYSGEAMAVAYKKNAFRMLWNENFWLSATPNRPGSKYGFDQSSCPRMANALCLVARGDGRPFVFCNTHLDHKGQMARLFGSMQLIQYLSSKPYPFVLTGDFNAWPDSPEITIFSNVPDFPITDCTDTLGCTFHAYGKQTENTGCKIDYIFTNMACDKSQSFVVPDEPVEGIYISDHYPVCATVNF